MSRGAAAGKSGFPGLAGALRIAWRLPLMIGLLLGSMRQRYLQGIQQGYVKA